MSNFGALFLASIALTCAIFPQAFNPFREIDAVGETPVDRRA
jgi:hypothetical protein